MKKLIPIALLALGFVGCTTVQNPTPATTSTTTTHEATVAPAATQTTTTHTSGGY